jgi:hypothetical protein
MNLTLIFDNTTWDGDVLSDWGFVCNEGGLP